MTNLRVLVLDDATEGLAPVIRNEIWRALADPKEDGLSHIVIDKNVKALMDLADRHFRVIVFSVDIGTLRPENALCHKHLRTRFRWRLSAAVMR